jgi:hypothetical protein
MNRFTSTAVGNLARNSDLTVKGDCMRARGLGRPSRIAGYSSTVRYLPLMGDNADAGAMRGIRSVAVHAHRDGTPSSCRR